MLDFKDMGNLNSAVGTSEGSDFFDGLQAADPETTKSLVADAKEYGAEKDKVKALDISLKQRKRDLRDKELALFDLFVAVGIESIKAGGRKYFTKVDTYASIASGDKDTAFAWIEEIGCDFLVEKAVNAKSLTREIKAYIEDGGDTPGEKQGIKLRTENRVVAPKK